MIGRLIGIVKQTGWRPIAAATMIVAASLVLATACSSAGAGSAATAQAISSATLSAMQSANTSSGTGFKSIAGGAFAPNGTVLSRSTGGGATTTNIRYVDPSGLFTISGTETSNVSGYPYTFTFDVTATFSSYTSNNITIDSGTLTEKENYTLQSTGSTSGTATETGTINVTYQGKQYTVVLNATVTFSTTASGTYTSTDSGTYTVDGTSYNFS